ncbi:MAG: hypothetical protein SNH13_02965 [Rikenellaceae bacterium]
MANYNDEQELSHLPNMQNFDPSEFEEGGDYNNQDPKEDGSKSSIRGYRIVVTILIVILTALSALYYNIHRQQMNDYDLLTVDRDSLQSNLSDIIVEFDELQINNDSLKLSMEIERHRADSIITQLKRERSFNYTKLKQYAKEVGTLRTIMRGYLQQIDSLNSLNKKLIDENVTYRKKISSVELRAEAAEERAQELRNKVTQGAILRARDISIVALNKRDREVSRMKSAERIRFDFTLAANELTTPGNKTIYVRVTAPDGYILTTNDVPTFVFEDQEINYTASRDVEYQNQDLNVSIFYAGSGFTAGAYKVELYAEGRLIGGREMILK